MIAPQKISRVSKLIKQNKAASAIKVGKQLLAKNQRNPELHYLLGVAYQAQGKPELALMEYRTVNQIGIFDGTVPETTFRRQLAELFLRYNQPDEALKEYLLLVQKEPAVADHYYHIGRLFEQRNQGAKAVGYYRKTISLRPNHGLAYLQLGLLLCRAKKNAEALKFLQKAIHYEPDHFEAYYYMGRIQKETKDFSGALKSLEWATKANDYKIKALIERGTCYIEMNNIERATSELERALANVSDPKNPDGLWAHFFLGTCYERMRKIELAIDHWEAIYRVKPGFQDVAEKLSQYQDLRQDDVVKDFLTASTDSFLEMCRSIAQAMKLNVQSLEAEPDGAIMVAIEAKTNWRNTKAMPFFVRFVRVAELIDEATVRTTYDDMRAQNITRARIIASTSFSRSAVAYAESRPIELFGKDHIKKFLKGTR